MLRYIGGRLVSLLFSIAAVSVITFFLMHSVPGGPFAFEKRPLPDFAMQNILRKYGLDRPVWDSTCAGSGLCCMGTSVFPSRAPQKRSSV